jgi:hypothetical protein
MFILYICQSALDISDKIAPSGKIYFKCLQCANQSVYVTPKIQSRIDRHVILGMPIPVVEHSKA